MPDPHALSAAGPIKVDFDLPLALMASSPYRLPGVRVSQDFKVAKARTILRKLVRASVSIEITCS